MKKLFFVFMVFLVAPQMYAQKAPTQARHSPQYAPNDAEARAAVENLTAKYSLNADQAKQMYGIQARKQRNMAQIEPLKASNPDQYRGKLESIQRGTASSIRRLLQSKEQVAVFNKTQVDLRGQRGQKRKELTVQGATKAAIEDAVLAIYQE